MSPQIGSVARKYHHDTKHSYRSVRSGSDGMDFSNEPMPYKIYRDLEPTPLPPEPPRSMGNAIACISGEASAKSQPLSLEILARLFFLTAGITKQIEAGGGSYYFRAAACTGALYHIELYLICGDVSATQGQGLSAGVYHLAVDDYSARALRRGDYRGAVAQALGRNERAQATFLFTSTYWRNAWKYGARTYRHCFWDGGTMLANLLATAAAFGIPARVNTGFADGPINQLLGLNTREEAALFVVELGAKRASRAKAQEIAPVHFETMPLSPRPKNFPEILKVHNASSLDSGEAVREWRSRADEFRASFEADEFYEGKAETILPLIEGEPSGDAIDNVILRRGSARRFARQPIGFEDLSLLLRATTRSLPADFLPKGKPALNDLYFIVNAVEGLPRGAYVFDRDQDALVLLKEGNFRKEAGYLGLEQSLAADASVNVYFLCELEQILTVFGDRGYRAAQLEAGVMGGRLYLGAYAQGLAASGLTFYDDEVISFFGPHAQGKEVMFLMLLGRRKSR